MKNVYPPRLFLRLLLAIWSGMLTGQVKAEPFVEAIQRGLNYTIWESVAYETDSFGALIAQTNRFTELASGLNVFRDGQWQPAKAEFEIVSGRVIARKGQFQVILQPNANSIGAVELLLPDGQQRLRSSFLALQYWDAVSGQTRIIGTIKDSQGQLLDKTTVLQKSV